MLDKEVLFQIISAAIEPERAIDIDSSSDNTPEWDSLGHLSILSSLDARTAGATSELDDISEADSIQKLIDALSSNDLLSEN